MKSCSVCFLKKSNKKQNFDINLIDCKVGNKEVCERLKEIPQPVLSKKTIPFDFSMFTSFSKITDMSEMFKNTTPMILGFLNEK